MDVKTLGPGRAPAGAHAHATAAPPLLMACLCAQWCDTCRDYMPVFKACAASFGAQVQPLWIDIEDDAELIDGIDVENFPTLLLAHGDALLFLGPITPQPQTLARLVASALAGDLTPRGGDAGGVGGVGGDGMAADVAVPLTRRLRARAAAR